MGIVRDMWRSLRRDAGELKRYSMAEWMQSFSFNGVSYPYGLSYSTSEKQEAPDPSFEGYTSGLYKSNSVVFACMTVRMLLFAEARFQFRQLRGGRPGDLFGNEDLALLENPWENATTGDLLARAIQDADIAGNFYARRDASSIKRLRPDWMTIVMGSQMDPDDAGYAPDAEVIGYVYLPGGLNSSYDPIPMLVEEVCHFAPIPDPVARFRGMSWLMPVIREVMGDNAATQHKLTHFEQGATRVMAVKIDPQFTPAQVSAYADAFREKHREVADAYKTMFLGGGAEPVILGTSLQELEFKLTQGAGETRIAAAAGVPPVIAGLSEGLAAATYSNYQQSIRRFTDLTMRPLWRNMAGSLASIIDVPSGSELWYDDRDIPALAEDVTEAAAILQAQATTMTTLVNGGWEPDAVVDAATAGDLKRLKGKHTGLNSVQLQPPAEKGAPESNGQVQLPIGADV